MATLPVEPVVLFQLALDGAGIVFDDSGPSHLPVTVGRTQAETNTVIDQNSDVTLFGLPTMIATRGLGSLPKRYIRVANNEPIAAGSNLCLEWWSYPILGSATAEAPAMATVKLSNNGLIAGFKHAATPNVRYYSGVEGIVNSGSLPYPFNAWHYNALQYVAADQKTYCSLDGVLVSTLNAQLTVNGSISFEGLLLASATNANVTNRDWSCRLAQVRCTRGNLYGSAAAPVPVAPWVKY